MMQIEVRFTYTAPTTEYEAEWDYEVVTDCGCADDPSYRLCEPCWAEEHFSGEGAAEWASAHDLIEDVGETDCTITLVGNMLYEETNNTDGFSCSEEFVVEKVSRG